MNRLKLICIGVAILAITLMCCSSSPEEGGSKRLLENVQKVYGEVTVTKVNVRLLDVYRVETPQGTFYVASKYKEGMCILK